MTVTTEETWKINGTTLNTMAYNIETLSGRFNIPPRRGSNIVIPYAPGRFWVAKQPDERPLTLAMWVRDADVDGVVPSTEQARRAKIRDNIETMKNLFGDYDTLLSLEIKIRLGSGLVTRTGQAECVNTLSFEWEENWIAHAKFIAELVMPDPFWYEGATAKL
jgi:hypothetical protein